MFSHTRTKSPKSLSVYARHRICIQLTVPVGNVLIGDAGGYIEHDDTALPVDIITIPKTSELLLSSSVPDIKLDITQVLQEVRF